MIERAILDNGIRFIGMPMSNFSSVTLGVFIKAGSMDEKEEVNGISHFLEHMLFKGTNTFSSKDIAFSIDRIGAELNAFTMRECTAIYTEVLKKYTDDAVKIMSDMIQNSIFSEEEISKEKTVIIDELMYYDDSPEDLVDDLLHEVSFKNTLLSQPVAGKVDGVNRIDRKKIVAYYKTHYNSDNIVIAAGGNYELAELMRLLNKRFSSQMKSQYKYVRDVYDMTSFSCGFKHLRKNIELNHFSIAVPAVNYEDDDLYAFYILNNIIGGSISSRLFQKIREDSGLTYTIDSSPLFYSKLGVMNIYFTALSENTQKLTRLLSEEFKSYKDMNISPDEFERGKIQILSSYLIGLEHTGDIMNWLGKSELLGDTIRDRDKVVSLIDKVKIEDVTKLARFMFSNSGISFVSVGKILKRDSQDMYFKLTESFGG